MKLRWMIWDYVDPDLGLSWTERNEIRRTARAAVHAEVRRRGRRSPGRLTLLVALQAVMPGIVALAVMLPVIWLIFKLGPSLPVILASMLLPLFTLPIALALMGLIGGYIFASEVNRELRRRGYDVCVDCGYSLRGLAEDASRCPECGADRTEMPAAQ